MTFNIKHFFAAGNTARGFTSLLHSSLQGIERLFVIDGFPADARQNLMQNSGSAVSGLGETLWMLHCASDPDSIDGWIAPGLKAGVVTGEAFRGLNTEVPGLAVQFIHLAEAVSEPASLEQLQSEIDILNGAIKKLHEQAYAGFAEALRIHDEWEALYIENMDFEAADRLTHEVIEALLGDRRKEKSSRVDHRFLGAATPKGSVDFVPNLTEGLKRYLVKGRAGSGKSTMLKKIAAAAEDRGFDVEIYHCGFDPNSLDMIIVREANFAIFDSTAPHEYFPEYPGDEIIDTYERCILPGTDEKYAEALAGFKARYSAKMKESIGCLTKAKSHLDALKMIYDPFVDDFKIDDIKEELNWQIVQGISPK